MATQTAGRQKRGRTGRCALSILLSFALAFMMWPASAFAEVAPQDANTSRGGGAPSNEALSTPDSQETVAPGTEQTPANTPEENAASNSSEKPAPQSEPANPPADETANQISTREAPTPDPTPDPQADAVAKIGEQGYETLQAAVNAAIEGQTIVLQKDVELNKAPVVANDKSFTLDLNGKTINAIEYEAFKTTDSTITVENGMIVAANTGWIPAISVDRGTHLTIAQNATVVGPYGIAVNNVFSDKTVQATAGTGTVIDVYGAVKGTDDASVLAHGGTIGIGINGNLKSMEAETYAKINVYQGASVLGSKGTNGGSLNTDDGPAVYAAGYGEWTFGEGCTVTGSEALSIKSGKFTIAGGAFSANGAYQAPATSWSNGSEATGAAVSITTNNAYAKNVELNIKDGSFTSENGYAFYESDTQSNAGTALKTDGLAIAGGKFVGKAGTDAVFVKNGNKAITGGIFSTDPTTYVADGYAVQKAAGDLGWIVAPYVSAQIVGGDMYRTLQEALDNATDGQTVQLLDHFTLEQPLVIDKAITLDLNQKVLTSQIQEGAAITFTKDATVENGTIQAIGQKEGATKGDGSGASGILAKGCTVTVDNLTVKAAAKAMQAGIYVKDNAANIAKGDLIVNGADTSIKGDLVGIMIVGTNAADAADASTLVVNAGNVEGNWYGVAGNGSSDGTDIVLNGGTIRGTNATDNVGIYHPQQGLLTINEGATVEGLVGVQMGGGSLVVNGGTVVSNDSSERTAPYKEPGEGDGSVLDGSALSVVSRAGGYGDIDVQVKGGTFETANTANDVVKKYGYKKGASAWEVIEPPTNTAVAITGGTFATDPSEFVAAGYEATEDGGGTYAVSAIRAVAVTVNGVETIYPSAAEAFASITDEASVKLLKNIEGSMAVAQGQTVELDLNGFTLTGVDNHAITNNGTLTIADSSTNDTGKVDGMKHACAALLNKGTATIAGGTFTRSTEAGANGSANGNSWYTVKNEGNLTVSGGTITNTSSYSSLVRNDGTMLVSGGMLRQDGIIAVNNYSTGVFEMTGGKIISEGDQGIINWHEASVSGGTITSPNAIASYADSSDTGATTVSGDAVINGSVRTVAYTNAGGVPSMKISGGEVNGTLKKQTYDKSTKTFTDVEANSATSELTVTGGTFANDPSAFLAAGYEAVEGSDGTFTIGVKEYAEVVHEDGTTTVYASLTEALKNAGASETVKLLKDTTENTAYTLKNNEQKTIDLQGHTLTFGDELATGITLDGLASSSLNVVGPGSVVAKGEAFRVSGGKLVIGEGVSVVSETDCCIFIYGYGTQAEVSGSLESRGVYATIQGNGTKIWKAVTLNPGAKVVSTQSHAIYMPGQGELTINGAEVAGAVTGVEIRAGVLNVSGDAKITGGMEAATAEANGNGSTTKNAAVAVAQHTTGLPISVNIESGTLTGNAALYESNPQGNAAETIAQVTLSVTGGDFNGTVYSEDVESFITGGTYSVDPSAYVPADTHEVVTADGKYLVQKQGDEAKIGDQSYSKLADAIKAAKAGETVTLAKNVKLAGAIAVSEKDFTLDLGGFTLSGDKGAFVTTKTAMTVQNGIIDTTCVGSSKAAIMVDRETNLTIAANAKVVGGYGINVNTSDSGKKSTAGAGTTIDVYGTVEGASTPEYLATGGSVALGINGLVTSKAEGTYATFRIHDGAVVTGYQGTTKGSANNIDDGPAVYAAGYGEWIIDEGAKLTGSEALGIKAGKFTINGGELAAMGYYSDPATSSSNGSEATGAVVSITKNGSYAGDVELTVAGGTFTSQSGHALYEGTSTNNTGTALKSIDVTAGTFTGASGKDAVSVSNGGEGIAFIAGGTYSTNPATYVVEGYESVEKDGKFVVQKMEYAQIGDVKYASLEAAFAAAQAGDTITVLKDTQMTGTATLAVEGAVTLDLAGFTVTGPAKTAARTSAIEVMAAADLTVSSSAEGGKIDYAAGKGDTIFTYGALALGENVTVTGNEHNTVKVQGGDVVVNGATITDGSCAVALFNRKFDNSNTDENKSATATVNSGTLSGTAYALSVNNLYSAGSEATIKGGTLTSTDGTAIYWPAEGKLIIENGTVSGATGIEMKMGDLVILGGSVAGTGAAGDPASPKNAASSDMGSGIYLVGKYYGALATQYRGDPALDVAIGGGTITSANGDAIAVYEGSADVSNAVQLVATAGSNAALTAANGKEKIAYYKAGGVTTPETRISASGVADATKHALAYGGIDGATGVEGNPAQVTAYDIVDITNPSKPDNTFKGWTVNETSYNKGDAFNVVLQGVAADATITATWLNSEVQGKAEAPAEITPDQPATEVVIGSPVGEKANIEETAAKTAQTLVDQVLLGSPVTGVKEQGAKDIQQVVAKAADASTITSKIEVAAVGKSEADVQNDANAIKTLVGAAEVKKYVDLSVKMVVEEQNASTANKAEVELSEVDQPIPFSVQIPIDDLTNQDGSHKGIQIATVHEGVASLINPTSVDYKKGIVNFDASKFSTYAVVLTASTAQAPTWTTIDGAEMFFANGTPVTIKEGSSADKVKIEWLDGTAPKSQEFGTDVSVFGGGHNNGSTFDTTSVTMTSGQVRNIFGGGLHKSNVGTANVAVNGGTAMMVLGGGAALLKDDKCGTVVAGSYPSDASKINNFVDTANVTIAGGTIASGVYGGGESISSVTTANVTIAGGDLSSAWVTAGGSNGYTGDASVEISGGTIKVVQGVNRGGMDAVGLNVTGGTIESLYLGGETGDKNVTGTVKQIDAVIGKDANIGQLATGTSGGKEIVGQAAAEVAAHLTVADTSKIGNFAEFAKASGDNLTIDATLDLNAAGNTVTFDPARIPNQTFAGESIEPQVKVLVNGVELAAGTYFLTYSDNVLPGTATITVHGADYVAGKAYVKGTATTTFTIVGVSANALKTAIDAATKLRAETVAADNSYNVVAGSYWATPSAVSAFSQAIGKAEGMSKQTITQTQMNAAVTELAAAGDTFKAARAKATVSKTALATSINAAKKLRDATKTSSNGSDIAPGTWWVTPLAMSAYNQAIAKAEGVNKQASTTQAAIDAAVSDLAKATSTFNNARKPGTKTDVVVGSAKRLAGAVATGTSQAISKEGFSKSAYAVVVRNDGFHDAMSATGLAGAYDCPILLTETGTLSAETKAELQRLGTTTVFVIGGTAAVSANVESQIKGLGMKVQRIAGSNAPDTSVQCAKAIQAKTGTSANAIMATSSTFQDALSMASFAYKYKVPILLLSASGEVVDGAKPYLAAASKVYVPGGTAAVSAAAVAPYQAKATRFAGSNAFDTSNKIAEHMVSSGLLSDASVGIANGLLYNGVDALAGSALMGKKGGVMLLTTGDDGGATIDGFLKAHGPKVAQAYVFGGTAVVTPALYSKIESLVK